MTRLLRPLLFLTAGLALCTAGCAGTRPAAVHTDGPLAGPWLLTVHPVEPRGIGSIRTVLTFEPSGTGGAFEAHSRSGAVGDLAGGFRASMAAMAGGEAYTRGALVHVYDGVLVPSGDSLRVSGRLVTLNFGALTLSAGLRDGRLRGVVRHPTTGAVVARIDAEPYGGALPLQAYGALVPEARALVAAHYHDPRVLDTPVWAGFWADAERRMGGAQDDLEAIVQFRTAARPLALSHFWIQRASPERAAPVGDDGRGLTFARRPDGVAVLTCREFELAQAGPVIEAAFAEMEREAPSALVVDLRTCGGGDLSSMLVAAHLLDAPAAGGLFLSNRWWRTHDAAPAREAWADLPSLAEPDLVAFFGALEAGGALVMRVEPASPVYRGPVYVLTSGRTASAAEPLAHVLQTTGRATLVGAPTAGAMLSSRTFPFGEGWELVVPVADYFTAEGARLEGHGVVPDVAAEPEEAMERAIGVIGD